MADDKIVTKKTAAKKTAQSKVTAPPSAASPPQAAQSAGSPSTAKKIVSPSSATTPEAATKGAAQAAPAAKKTAASKKTTASEARSAHRDNPGNLKKLATVTPEQRQKMIEEAAFYKAEKRNFAPGHQQEDWTDAEREIDELIARARAMTGT